MHDGATMSLSSYPSASAVDGVTFRRAVVPDDLTPMNDVANVARLSEGTEWVTSYEAFRTYYENLSNCDLTTDLVIAERDGVLIGYGRASWHDEVNGERVYDITVLAHPDHAATLMGPLHDMVEARLREIAASHPPGPKHLQAESTDGATIRTAVLEARGYLPVRYGFYMLRPNLDDLADADLPDGFEVRPVQPDHLRAIFEAEQEAFRDHWGASVPTEEDFRRFVADPNEGDTSLWQVAWAGDEVAGMVRAYINAEENERLHRRRGMVENISVRRPYRRRGLARALIARAIRALRERGMTEGALGVDTENPSGALRLYESCGFVAVKRDAVYRKPLD
jgi:mycothiol synthase